MPDYRRYRVPGGVKCTRPDRPFHIDAWVVLPDHMHCVITLPPGDGDFSNRIKAVKIRFVQALPPFIAG
jgi:putative transposase